MLSPPLHSQLLQALLCRPPGGGYSLFGRLLHEVLPYDRLTLCAAEADGLRVVVALCAGDETSEAVGRLIPFGGSLAGGVFRGGRPLRITHLQRTLKVPEAAAPEDVLRALRVGMQAGIFMPLFGCERGERGDHPIGLCQLWAREAGRFTAAHEELLAAVGTALGAALSSDVLFAQAERRSLELGALERLSRKTRETLTLDQVAPTCLDTALSLLGQPSGGLFLHEGDQLHLIQERNVPPAIPRALPLSPDGPGTLWRALRDGRPVLCEEPALDPDLGETLLREGKGWILGIPLLSGQERCGVIFASGPAPFGQGPAELARLSTVGAWLGTAIAEARRQAQTRRREAEQRRAQHLESLGTLAGGLAHDLNNTLGAVLCTALLVRDAAARGPMEPLQLQQDMDTIALAARRGAELAGQLLAFSRGAPLSLQLLDVNELVEAACGGLQLRAGTPCQIFLDASLGPGLPRVRGDREQLLRALQNLLRNAEEAMVDGGRLRVSTGLVEATGEGEGGKGTFVRVAVEDNGPGVDEAVRGRLFEPFVSTKNAPGLGLAVAFGVLRAHGGHVTAASSRSRGRGASFFLDLPPAEALAPVIPATPAERARVLVVDDEPALGRVALRILTRGGHQVDVAANGRDALLRYDRPGAYDLVILDSTMPGMSGREVLDELLRRDAGCRVLVMSGYSSDGGPAQLLREGARGFLPKPFTPAELLQAARAALEGAAP